MFYVLGVLVGESGVTSNVIYSISVFITLPFFVAYGMGGDGSWMVDSYWGGWFVGLSLWVGAWSMVTDFIGGKNSWGSRGLKVLVVMMVSAFCVSAASSYYFLLEASLVPISMMVLVGGSRPERVSAVVYMVMFTVVGGAGHLISLIYLYTDSGGTWWYIQDTSACVVWTLGVYTAFLVKAPLYGVHFWLPKAHVEASTAGSMMLAAIMLKLGIFGMYRFQNMMVGGEQLWTSVQGLGLIGAVSASVMALRQPDTKSVMAYASVAHMSLTVACLFTGTIMGVQGAMMLSVAHGMAASAMFSWAGVASHSSGTRSVFYLAGGRRAVPAMAFLFILLLMFSSAVPPFMSLYPELLVWGGVSGRYGSGSAGMLISAGVLGIIMFIFLFVKGGAKGAGKHSNPTEKDLTVLVGQMAPGVISFFYPGMLIQ